MSVSTSKKSKYTQMDFVIHSREKKTSNLCCWKSLKVILELIISVFQKNSLQTSFTFHGQSFGLRLGFLGSLEAWSYFLVSSFKCKAFLLYWKEFLTLCKPLKISASRSNRMWRLWCGLSVSLSEFYGFWMMEFNFVVIKILEIDCPKLKVKCIKRINVFGYFNVANLTFDDWNVSLIEKHCNSNVLKTTKNISF